jgi:hypothetical protein
MYEPVAQNNNLKNDLRSEVINNIVEHVPRETDSQFMNSVDNDPSQPVDQKAHMNKAFEQVSNFDHHSQRDYDVSCKMELVETIPETLRQQKGYAKEDMEVEHMSIFDVSRFVRCFLKVEILTLSNIIRLG